VGSLLEVWEVSGEGVGHTLWVNRLLTIHQGGKFVKLWGSRDDSANFNRFVLGVILLAVALAGLVGFVVMVRAQSPLKDPPKADPPAQVFRLNPEASQMWGQIDKAEGDLQRQFAQLENQRAALLVGASVPKDYWQHCTVEGNIVACYPPSKSTPTPR
jgi:hypothetical protein